VTAHPAPEQLVGDLDPWVSEHLRGCPRCRIDRRLLRQTEDASDASGDDEARSVFEELREAGLPDPTITWRSSVASGAGSSVRSGDGVGSDLLSAGRDLGRYTVEALLGRGGMAAVYQVRHNDLGTRHALKVMLLPSPAMCERLLREGRAQGRLRHSNIVAVTDTVTVDGSPGLVVELIEGPALDEVLLLELLPLDIVDAIVADVSAGVGAAHRAGFVHRDLKPANVLLSVEGERLVAKVADFGLVKALVGEGDNVRTRTGAMLGTPAYMAPEQIRDASRVDARTDVFALGAILYELVTGVRAFGGRDTLEVFNRITNGEKTPLEALRADVPPRMRRAIEAALQPEPSLRPPSVEALVELWSDGEAATLGRQVEWDEAWLDRLAGLRDVHALPTTSAASSTEQTFDWSPGSGQAPSTGSDPSEPSPIEPSPIEPPPSEPDPSEPSPSEPEPSEPEPADPRAPRRRWPWLLVGGLTLLVVGAVAVAALRGPPTSTVPEQLAGVPRIDRLAGDGGLELFPSLGPHGDVVVYSDGVDLYSRRVGATTSHPLTDTFAPAATQPAVSPDGGRIALSAEGAVWVMGERGGDARMLVSEGYWPAWSPDGREVVYATGDEADIWVARQRASEVWVVDVATGERRKVADYGVQPVFAADGETIAFFDGDEVQVVHADGSGPVGRTKGTGISHWHPQFTDDGLFALSNRGEAMVLQFFTDLDSRPADVMTLPITWDVDVHGGRVVASTVQEHFAVLEVDLEAGAFSEVGYQRMATSPALGPDGHQAVVMYQSPEQLVVRAPDGQERTIVRGGSLRAPAFSPDGQRLSLSADHEEGYGPYVVDLDGSHLRRLAPGNLGPTHWSADGERLSWSNGQPRVTRIDAPADAWGGEDHEGLDGFWAGPFSPDGDAIIVRSPSWTLHVLDTDTFELSEAIVDGSDAAWLDPNTWLVARDDELVRVDVSTGEQTVAAALAPWRVTDQPSLAVRDRQVLVGVRRIEEASILVADFPSAR